MQVSTFQPVMRIQTQSRTSARRVLVNLSPTSSFCLHFSPLIVYKSPNLVSIPSISQSFSLYMSNSLIFYIYPRRLVIFGFITFLVFRIAHSQWNNWSFFIHTISPLHEVLIPDELAVNRRRQQQNMVVPNTARRPNALFHYCRVISLQSRPWLTQVASGIP